MLMWSGCWRDHHHNLLPSSSFRSEFTVTVNFKLARARPAQSIIFIVWLPLVSANWLLDLSHGDEDMQESWFSCGVETSLLKVFLWSAKGLPKWMLSKPTKPASCTTFRIEAWATCRKYFHWSFMFYDYHHFIIDHVYIFYQRRLNHLYMYHVYLIPLMVGLRVQLKGEWDKSRVRETSGCWWSFQKHPKQHFDVIPKMHCHWTAKSLSAISVLPQTFLAEKVGLPSVLNR